MNITSSQVEAIVRRILGESLSSTTPAGGVPKTGKVAMLTAQKTIEVKEFPIPTLEDDDILVKVEGCGVCGTDVHEWKGDPFGLIPVTLGHEGTGEIVALGKNVKMDTAGKPIKVGDKIVTSVISCGECFVCRNQPANTSLLTPTSATSRAYSVLSLTATLTPSPVGSLLTSLSEVRARPIS